MIYRQICFILFHNNESILEKYFLQVSIIQSTVDNIQDSFSQILASKCNLPLHTRQIHGWPEGILDITAGFQFEQE